MGLFDVISGRSKRPANRIDQLFAIPSAGVTLQTASEFRSTGSGSVCFRGAEGPAFAQTLADIVELLDSDDDTPVKQSHDEFGFLWLTVEQPTLEAMATDLHAVNTGLEAQGFADGLLCSMFAFVDNTGRKLALVYLYKKGTFYPFAPTGARTRDNLLELQIQKLLEHELPIEPDLSQWMALWGAPGL
ncbi:MAG: hypothetical protein QM655_09165 [Nocardioidaceae bacterium]